MNPDPNDSYIVEKFYEQLYEQEEEDYEDPDEKYERDRDLKHE